MSIVTAEWLFTGERWERRHGFVLRAGGIHAVGPPDALALDHPGEPLEDWGRVAVVPGTVNAHAHSFQVLLRGLGDDLPFARWRDRVLYPYAERLDREAIRTGALLDFTEMARAGVTTVVDFFYLHDGGNENALAVVDAAREVGVRIVLARAMYDWTGAPARFQESADASVRRFRELHEALRGDARAFAQPAPHSVHAASPATIQAGARLAEELGIPFHIHVAEGRYERDQTLERHGLSPVRFLDALGVLSERTVMVHCVWVDDDDVALMAERRVKVVHNPGANAFLGDGIAPLRDFLDRGIDVCLGTDGGCTNSRQSVFEEARMAALLVKATRTDAGAMTAETALGLATAAGGVVLGLPVGRIAPGHAADLVVLDLDALSLQPSGTAPKQVVYSMQPDAIARVIVGGETIVEGGRPTRVDPAEIRARVARVTGGWYGDREPSATEADRPSRAPGDGQVD